MLLLNIRGMNKNFESFKEFYLTINLWVDNISFSENSNFQLSGHKVLHQTRKICKGGGVCVSVHKSFSFSLREDLNINSDAILSLSVEISITKSRCIMVNFINSTA